MNELRLWLIQNIWVIPVIWFAIVLERQIKATNKRIDELEKERR